MVLAIVREIDQGAPARPGGPLVSTFRHTVERRFARPKLIAVDLDGTLLDERGEPHRRDVCALQAAAREGIVVTIVTGRLYSGTRASAAALGLSGPVACVDGSHVVDAVSHETLLHQGIRGAAATSLRDAIGRAGPSTFLFVEDTILHDEAGQPYLQYVQTWSRDLRRTSAVGEHELWQRASGVTAVVAVGTAAQIGDAVEEIRQSLSSSVQVTMFPVRRIANAWGLVARAKGGTKGTALLWIASYYGCDRSEVVAVGDWFNDVPMFQVAGRSFAMGHAPEGVKRAATDVVEETSSEGGGIARAVEQALDERRDGTAA